jgi:hypothetical protein
LALRAVWLLTAHRSLLTSKNDVRPKTDVPRGTFLKMLRKSEKWDERKNNYVF